MNILLDMDGVIVDQLPTWLKLYHQAGGEFVRAEDCKVYSMDKNVKDMPLLWSRLDSSLALSEPMPGALEGIAAMERTGHTVTILTHVCTHDALGIKMRWLSNYNLGHLPVVSVSRSLDKALVRGDVLVEDNLVNVQTWELRNPSGNAFLIEHAYNHEAKALMRGAYGNWQELLTWLA